MFKLVFIIIIVNLLDLVLCFNNFDKYIKEIKNSGKMNTILRFTVENIKTIECYEDVINDRQYKKCIFESLKRWKAISGDKSKITLDMNSFCCSYFDNIYCLNDSVQRVCDPKQFKSDEESRVKWTQKYGSICHEYPLDKLICGSSVFIYLHYVIYFLIFIGGLISLFYISILFNYYFLKIKFRTRQNNFV
jgi:hypothetical protein